MRREENDDLHEGDTLYITPDEIPEMMDEVGPNAHGDPKEGFERVIIEIEGSPNVEFSGYGGASRINVAMKAQGLNGESCFQCGEEKHERALTRIRGGPEDRAVHVCRDCRKSDPIADLLSP